MLLINSSFSSDQYGVIHYIRTGQKWSDFTVRDNVYVTVTGGDCAGAA